MKDISGISQTIGSIALALTSVGWSLGIGNVALRSTWGWTLPCDTAHSVLGFVLKVPVLGSDLKVFAIPPLDWFFTGGELLGRWFLFGGDKCF